MMKFIQLFSFFVLGIIFSGTATSLASDNNRTHGLSPDSIGNAVINNDRFVRHKLAPQETYYQLSRTYGVPVKDIMQANNKKTLRIGDTVRIPRGKVATVMLTVPETPDTPQENQSTPQVEQDIFTEYIVGKKETLFAISRRFDVSVNAIKQTNNLTSDNLRESQILKIPNNSPQEVEETSP